jgi:hypothetical protein
MFYNFKYFRNNRIYLSFNWIRKINNCWYQLSHCLVNSIQVFKNKEKININVLINQIKYY